MSNEQSFILGFALGKSGHVKKSGLTMEQEEALAGAILGSKLFPGGLIIPSAIGAAMSPRGRRLGGAARGLGYGVGGGLGTALGAGLGSVPGTLAEEPLLAGAGAFLGGGAGLAGGLGLSRLLMGRPDWLEEVDEEDEEE